MKRSHFISILIAGIMVIAMTACGSAIASTTTEYDEVLASSESIPTETTVQGDSGADVEALQKYLIALGFLDDEADGQFGENTKNAVTAFQELYGIEVTGEADENTLAMLKMLVESIATEAEDSEYALTMFRSINILRYEDGKYYVEPNTVSDKTFESAESALKAVINAFKNSTEVPAVDGVIQVKASELPNEFNIANSFVNLDALRNYAAKNDGITFVDAGDNTVTIDADGTVTSDTGNIYSRTVDYDDNRPIILEDNHDVETALKVEMIPMSDITDEFIEANNDNATTSDVEVAASYSFRTIMLDELSNDGFQVAVNTVSQKTLNEFRKAYTAIRYAYLHSTEIPTSDVETRIQVDAENLPDGVTKNDLTYDESTDTYYITTRDIQRIADEIGTPVTVNDTDGNQVTVDRLGDTTTDTGNIVSQTVNKDTKEPETTGYVSKPVEETKQQETKPSTPVAEIPTETTTVNPEPETQKATDNKPAETKPAETKPADTKTARVIHHDAEYKTVHHDAVTHTVHHDAVTHTVNHPAETHEETTYTTVHHDATYKTVHHDAVVEQQWVQDTPDTEAYTLYITCTQCWEKWEVPEGMSQGTATKMWFNHCLEEHNGNGGYTWEAGPVTVIPGTGHYEDVVVTAAWDEQVLVKDAWVEQVATGTKTVIGKEAWVETVVDVAAWDEVIVDKEAWDEQVLVKEAWDEVIYE